MQGATRHLRLPALLMVLAAHALAVAILLRPDRLEFPTAAPSLINLASTTRPPINAASGMAIEPLRVTVSPFAPGFATDAIADNPAQPSQANIDWQQEIHRQAESTANVDVRHASTSRSDFEDLQITGMRAARHYAGEQFRDNDGTWTVWINPACYQVSDHVRVPAISGRTVAPTYCAGQSAIR